MDSRRRQILKFFGISAIGVCTTHPVRNAFAAEQKSALDYTVKTGDAALKAKQWAMVIDTRQFESSADLEPLIEACHKIHNVPHFEDPDVRRRHEIKWLWEEDYEHAFPMKENQFLNEAVESKGFLVLCNHCENPPCCRACPTRATFKRESDGIVLMDFHRCIGCRFCMAACPFGARSFNFRDPRPHITEQNNRFPTRMKGVVEKCNFCAERLAEGQMPACVEASNGAIAFGDLYDPDSEVRKLLRENYTIRRKQSLGTEPSVYYIV
jgi:molybdopterin-containing oxidoreductase family iron-sulfur binding subunit